jgi:hypothetical protein
MIRARFTYGSLPYVGWCTGAVSRASRATCALAVKAALDSQPETWIAYVSLLSVGIVVASGVVHLASRHRRASIQRLVAAATLVVGFVGLLWWPLSEDPYNPHREGRPVHKAGGIEAIRPSGVSTVDWDGMTPRDWLFVVSVGLLALAVPGAPCVRNR